MTIRELLTFRGVRWRRGATPGEINVCCPFCGEKRFRLGINIERRIGHCFNCDWKSRNAIRLLLRQLNLGDVTISGGDLQEEETGKKELDLPEGFFLLSEISKDDGSPFYDPRRYLLRRGVSANQIRVHFLGATLLGRFSYRIVIPVHYRRELKGIVARTWLDAEPKYLNSSGEKALYNLKEKTAGQKLVLSEGCFKALAIEAAMPGVCSCAVLGHSITDGQIEQIHDAGFREVIIFSDPDAAGIRGTLMIAEKLLEHCIFPNIIYPIPEAQADELSPTTIRAHFQSVKPFTNSLRFRLKRDAI